MEPIFHIADEAAWDAATATGHYAQSTRDQSLDEVGFIHCSYRHQLLSVATNFYADVTMPLVLITIEPELLDAALLPEPPTEGAEPFPHIYGALNVGAVLSVTPFVKDQNGQFIFDE